MQGVIIIHSAIVAVLIAAGLLSGVPTAVCEATFDYTAVLHKSLLFYEAQRSGELPADNRISWRQSAMVTDKGNNGENLSGGYFDAGDYMKFGYPMAWTMTVLAWGVIENRKRFESAGEYENVLKAIKWGTDYFIKCHVEEDELYGHVGNVTYDHEEFWGRAEQYNGTRPAYKVTKSNPGTDLAMETAAAMAAAAMVFTESGHAEYAGYNETLKVHARSLYLFGKTYRGLYHQYIPDAREQYPSTGYEDEMAWGALWLYWATGEESYFEDFEEFERDYSRELMYPYAFSWDDKKYGVYVLSAFLANDMARYDLAIASLSDWLPGEKIDYTPMGLAWREMWGVNRYAASMAFLGLVLAKNMERVNYRVNDAAVFSRFGREQVNYFLGSGPQSFLVGFGKNWPDRVHHRGASCPDRPSNCSWPALEADAPNPQVLEGALVGGPGKPCFSGEEQCFVVGDDFKNNRTDHVRNEVALDYNAGFQSAVAFLVDGEDTFQEAHWPETPSTAGSFTAGSLLPMVAIGMAILF